MEQFIKLFVRIEPGLWRCVRDGEFNGPTGRIHVTVGSTFTLGTTFMGTDLAQWLEDQHAKTGDRH